MRYVCHQKECKLAAEVIDAVPLGSARNRDTLLGIADEWRNLVLGEETSSALRSNLATLTETLSELGRFSILRTVRSACEGQTTVLYIEETSPINIYEADTLVSVAREIEGANRIIQDDQLPLCIKCPFGTIHISGLLDNYNVKVWTLEIQVHDRKAYNEFLDLVEQRHDALAAGKHFAAALKDATETGKDLDSAEAPVQLGSYVFRGRHACAAVEAFLARNIPEVNQQVHINPSNILKQIASRVVSRRVIEIEHPRCYEIRGDFISYRLSLAPNEGIEVSAHVIPNQISRDFKYWFASSEAAKEITSILFATGIGRVLPELVEHGVELETMLRFGNGYASVSRIICNILSEVRNNDREKLKDLDKLFEGTLINTLLKFRDMSTLESTRLVLDLLVGAIGSSTARLGLPTFSLPDPDRAPRVNSCDDVEGYFVKSVKAEAYHTDKYFLHKKSGEATALTRVPIIVGGAVIPKGTLCCVKKSGEEIDWVKPIRLTLFSLPLDGEGSEVFRHHLNKIGESRGDNDAAIRAVYDLLYGER